MRVGVFTPLLASLPLDGVLKKLAALNIRTVELGTGNYPGDPHCKLSMLENAAERAEFKQQLNDNGFSISALSCHGNPLHPDAERARHDQEVSRKTILLAEKLGVPVVVDFSGCPGDSPNAKYPNWVTCPWPPEYLDVLRWQWDEVVAPYWTAHAKFAADHGVKIAIEMHPGFVAYSPETLLKLRSLAGPSIGCNYDPSHMFWQGIDPSPPSAYWAMPSSMCMPKTRKPIPRICLLPACSTPRAIPMSAIAPGSSAPVATATARSGGASSSPPYACSVTITCCPSNTRTACFRPKRG